MKSTNRASDQAILTPNSRVARRCIEHPRTRQTPVWEELDMAKGTPDAADAVLISALVYLVGP